MGSDIGNVGEELALADQESSSLISVFWEVYLADLSHHPDQLRGIWID